MLVDQQQELAKTLKPIMSEVKNANPGGLLSTHPPSAQSVRQRLKPRQMREIVLPLVRPPVVTRLVLRTHQAVRTTTTVGRQVQVAPAPPARLFHVTTPGFGSLEAPRLAVGIGQEVAEL